MTDYFLPQNYVANFNPVDFDDWTGNEDLYWQPDVYILASWLAERYDCHVVDLGCGNGKKLTLFPEIKTIGYDRLETVAQCLSNFPDKTWKVTDLSAKRYSQEVMDDCRDGVIILSDVIEHLVSPEIVLYFLKQVLPHSKAIVISTPDRVKVRGRKHQGPPDNEAHVREWSLKEFKALLTSFGLKPKYAFLTRENTESVDHNTITCVLMNSKLPKL